MNTNLVQIDPATLSAIQSLPPEWQHWAIVAAAVLSVLAMLGRAATALINDAPVLKSVFLGSIHSVVPDPTSAAAPLVMTGNIPLPPVTSASDASHQTPVQTVGVVTTK